MTTPAEKVFSHGNTVDIPNKFRWAINEVGIRKNTRNPISLSKWGSYDHYAQNDFELLSANGNIKLDNWDALRNLFYNEQREQGQKSSVEGEESIQSQAMVLSESMARPAKYFSPEEAEEVNVEVSIEIKKLSIVEPLKMEGVRGYMIYTIESLLTYKDIEEAKTFTTQKSSQQILDLYNHLQNEYIELGVIVPPPPNKKCSIRHCKHAAVSSGHGSTAAIDINCVPLQLYMKKLAEHPVICRDQAFLDFIQDNEVRFSKKKSGSAYDRLKAKLSKMFAPGGQKGIHDDWISLEQGKMSEMLRHLHQTEQTVRNLAQKKSDLGKTFETAQILQLSNLINDAAKSQVINAHEVMNKTCKDQSHAYVHFGYLILNHIEYVKNAKRVLAVGQTMQDNCTKFPSVENELQLEKFIETLKTNLDYMDRSLKFDFEQAISLNRISTVASLSDDASMESLDIIDLDKEMMKEPDIPSTSQEEPTELNNEGIKVFGQVDNALASRFDTFTVDKGDASPSEQ